MRRQDPELVPQGTHQASGDQLRICSLGAQGYAASLAPSCVVLARILWLGQCSLYRIHKRVGVSLVVVGLVRDPHQGSAVG